jgi:hypothetical protein
MLLISGVSVFGRQWVMAKFLAELARIVHHRASKVWELLPHFYTNSHQPGLPLEAQSST